MILALILIVALLVAAGIYRARCAWSPYGSRGRRRAVYWVRVWWRGDNAENRDN